MHARLKAIGLLASVVVSAGLAGTAVAHADPAARTSHTARVAPDGSGQYFSHIEVANTGMCLDADANHKGVGTRVNTQRCNGSYNQDWYNVGEQYNIGADVYMPRSHPGYAIGLTSWNVNGKVVLKKIDRTDKSIWWQYCPSGDSGSCHNQVTNYYHTTLSWDSSPVGNPSAGKQLEVAKSVDESTQNFEIILWGN